MSDLEARVMTLHHNGGVWVTAEDYLELEAKLAKAEIIVRIIASAEFDKRLGEAVDLSCEYLAELTGGENDRQG